MHKTAVVSLCTLLYTAHPSFAAEPEKGPTQDELTAASSNSADWLHPNHDYNGSRFVALGEINRTNVGRLNPVCIYQAGDNRSFETNPIVYRGVMYITTADSTVALDAATCRVRWSYVRKAKAHENGIRQRGAALKGGTLVRGTPDGYLLALNADTGDVLWERAAGDAAKGESFSMPPLIYQDLVIIGPGGNEQAVKGWVGAFRLDTGEPVWRFNTFPDEAQPGSDTWSITKATTAGGAVWTPFALDADAGLVYIPTGNPAPVIYGDVRQGDNLYTSSLVVLNARTGRLVWHYQATPHDIHDWDLTQTSPLFTTDINGTSRKLVVVAGKDGLLRVLDRAARELMYEVAVTRRENATAPVTVEGLHVCPGVFGGVEWNGPAFSPRTNTLYVSSVDWCGTFRLAEMLRFSRPYVGGSYDSDPVSSARGWLTAVDASTGDIRWKYQSSRPMLAAVTATSSDLIFTGELDGDFIALDARDGKVLYRFNTGAAISGGVITYQVDGKQFVAVTSGAATRFWQASPASAAIIVFALPAGAN